MNSVIDNDRFVYLLRAAQEDKALRQRLLEVLRLDDINRFSAFEAWASHAESLSAPKDFVNALRYLKNPSLAFEAMTFLTKKPEPCCLIN